MFKQLRSRDQRALAMGASLVVSFLMLAGKVGAYLITDSTAIFSDAAESVVHLLATSIAGFSLWYAQQPPDRAHPYGHGKIAYFSTAVEGGLILSAAVAVMYSGIRALIEGHQLFALGTGLVVLVVLTVVNLVLGLYLIRVGRAHNAMVLVANGQHVLTDMWTSLGVIVGVGLVWGTGALWIDAVVAILVGGNITWTAVKLLKTAYEGLMERVAEEHTDRIVETLDEVVEENLISGYHQLRHRRVNEQIFIELHLLFPEEVTVHDAHEYTNEVERRLQGLFPGHDTYVTAHMEPEHHEEAHPEDFEEPEDPLPSTFRSGY